MKAPHAACTHARDRLCTPSRRFSHSSAGMWRRRRHPSRATAFVCVLVNSTRSLRRRRQRRRHRHTRQHSAAPLRGRLRRTLSVSLVATFLKLASSACCRPRPTSVHGVWFSVDVFFASIHLNGYITCVLYSAVFVTVCDTN